MSQIISDKSHIPSLETLHARRDEIIALAKAYGAVNIRVVGSVARGEETPHDVDLLIRFPEPRSVFDLVGLWAELEALLGCAVSIIPESTSDQAFMQSVLKDAVAL